MLICCFSVFHTIIRIDMSFIKDAVQINFVFVMPEEFKDIRMNYFHQPALV